MNYSNNPFGQSYHNGQQAQGGYSGQQTQASYQNWQQQSPQQQYGQLPGQFVQQQQQHQQVWQTPPQQYGQLPSQHAQQPQQPHQAQYPQQYGLQTTQLSWQPSQYNQHQPTSYQERSQLPLQQLPHYSVSSQQAASPQPNVHQQQYVDNYLPTHQPANHAAYAQNRSPALQQQHLGQPNGIAVAVDRHGQPHPTAYMHNASPRLPSNQVQRAAHQHGHPIRQPSPQTHHAVPLHNGTGMPHSSYASPVQSSAENHQVSTHTQRQVAPMQAQNMPQVQQSQARSASAWPTLSKTQSPYEQARTLPLEMPTSISPALLQRVPPTSLPAPVTVKQPAKQHSPAPAIKQEAREPAKIPVAAVLKPSPAQAAAQTNSQSLSSPRMAVKSVSREPLTPSTIAPSPVVHAKPVSTLDQPSMLLHVAEECLNAAQKGMHEIAASPTQANVAEYEKLITISLRCLDGAISSKKLAPRIECIARLRYASVLSEETDNLAEAEAALIKGLSVCEKSRLMDLKNAMDYMLLKILFCKNHKAALIAADKHIAEYMTYKQVHWVYALRFLKAHFYLQSGTPADAHALDNLRHILTIARSRGDVAVSVLVNLLEGLAHLKGRRHDHMSRVQHCLAQALKYQEDSSAHSPQLDVLTMMLDLACSLQLKSQEAIKTKLAALMQRMDALLSSTEWTDQLDKLLLPMKKQASTATSISEDTAAVIRPGSNSHDFMVLSFLTQTQAFALGYIVSGLSHIYTGGKPEKMLSFWSDGLRQLAKSDAQMRPPVASLAEALNQASWRTEVSRYVLVLMTFLSASRSQWAKAGEYLQKLDALQVAPGAPASSLDAMAKYAQGVYYQGIGDLAAALHMFDDSILAIENHQRHGHNDVPEDIAILAALNRIWIMQSPSHRNDAQTVELVEQLQPYCAEHPDIEIKTAFHLVLGAIDVNPPLSLNVQKRHISIGVNGAKATGNTQLLSIALSLMRSKLFENILGQQAITCARAASSQARKSGNFLWMSVADGMLAKSCEISENSPKMKSEAKGYWESGTKFAGMAFSGADTAATGR